MFVLEVFVIGGGGEFWRSEGCFIFWGYYLFLIVEVIVCFGVFWEC